MTSLRLFAASLPNALLMLLLLASPRLTGADVPVQVWARQLGTPAEDFLKTLAVDPAGNCYLAGKTSGDLAGKNAGKSDVVVGKFDTAGQRLWLIQFGTAQDDTAISIALDAAGNAYVTGETGGKLGQAQFGGKDGFVAKIDPLGKIIWLEQFGSAEKESPLGITRDASGNLFVTGAITGKPVGTEKPVPDVFVSKIDPDGHWVWTRRWGTASFDTGNSIAVDSQGNLYVTGQTLGDLAGQGNGGKSDLFVTKLDPEGKVVWLRQFGTPDHESGMNLKVDRKGNIYVAGSSAGDLAAPQVGQGDAVLLKLSSQGDLLWKQQFGYAGWDGIHGLAFSSDGFSRVIVGGCAGGEKCRAFLREFDTEGNELWQTVIATDQSLCGTQIGLDGRGNIYQVGGTHGPAFGNYEGTGNDIVLVKLAPEKTP